MSTLYETVADRIRGLIDTGTFRAGDKVPSVRRLSGEMKVSVSTVLEAYALLESRGLIEARPQSGYYVRAPFPTRHAEMSESKPPRRPCHIGVDELVMRVLDEAADPSLVQLGAALGNPDLLPTARLDACMAAAARRLKGAAALYDVPPGNRGLRVQVARRAVDAGCTISPDDIVITSGALEALTLCLRATCKPGDTIAIESPSYFGVLQAMELMGLRALEIPTHPRHGMSVDALRFALDQHRIKACLVTTNFSNPLGSHIPDEAKAQLVSLLADAGVPLIEDDVYGELTHGRERPRAAKSWDRSENVMLCSSFSKDLAPGYRVGWVASGRWRRELARIKMATNVATATLPQIAIADFLEQGGYDHHLRRIRRVYADQVALVARSVLRYFPEGTTVTQPEGGFMLWAEMPPAVDVLELYERALRAGIGIAPGPIFSPKGRYRHHMRLNCSWWSERIDRALLTLGRLTTDLMEGRP